MKMRSIGAYLKQAAYAAVYKHYEKRLQSQINSREIPDHVGLILDGNRRWAKDMGLSINDGHKYGFEKLKEVLKWCWELGIHTVTVYALSTENFNRSDQEMNELLRLAEKGFKDVLDSKDVVDNEVKIIALGRLDLLSESLRSTISDGDGKDQGLRQEQAQRGNRLRRQGRDNRCHEEDHRIGHERRPQEGRINEGTFSKYLYTAGQKDPDLIIRTSGEERLSGFLLWQSAYSEFYFLDVYWPELRRIDFLRAIRTYQRRKRRFGM
jgi:tritrans,polycis-undecaprenyl-diphosphate synthase [geranylgeranyl-diphosphate specific]